MFGTSRIFFSEIQNAARTYESVVRQATCAVKNLILAMNGEKPIAQVNPEVPVKKVVWGEKSVKPFPIPEIEQMNAMIDGSFDNLLSNYVENPPKWDFRKFITINRQKLIEFLDANSDKAKTYFQKQVEVKSKATHDVAKIWQEGNNYFVAWMDHGRARNPRQFNTIAEAVAELVLVNYGMY